MQLQLLVVAVCVLRIGTIGWTLFCWVSLTFDDSTKFRGKLVRSLGPQITVQSHYHAVHHRAFR